ncbi:Fic family protein [Candidatus Peregrinibacteria bacterium]|nr:Fic family protein [Candidatus Peregrinibacteria bacterium]
MKQLIFPTKRQQYILQILAEFERLSNREILARVKTQFDKASRVTVIRELNHLVEKKLAKRQGKGRNIFYELSVPRLLRPIDAEDYFRKNPDQRTIQQKRINFKHTSDWNAIFQHEELKRIDTITRKFKQHFSKYSPELIKKELERITIEFSWKSSQIEGNTYSLLDTERLIKEHKEAKGKTHEEAVMILNHKNTLEYIWKYPNYFKKISLRKIEDIHTLIIKNLNIQKGLRKRPVGIIGTKYMPYDNIYQIREAIEDLCKLINTLKNPFIKAMAAISGISYIQPFEDGNKRTSRLLGNALLLAYFLCPLSFRSADEIEYKKSMILFYEQHNLFLFKKIFMEQYEFAIQNYFLI